MKRWVGLGVIADNLVNIGRAIEKTVDPVVRPRSILATSRLPAVPPAGFALGALLTASRNINFAPESS